MMTTVEGSPTRKCSSFFPLTIYFSNHAWMAVS